MLIAIQPVKLGEELKWQHQVSMEIDTSPLKPIKPGDSKTDSEGEEFKVICYFTNWAWYRPEGGRYLPEDIDPDLCTHILYGFAVLDATSLTIKSHDPWADIDNSRYSNQTVNVSCFKFKYLSM